MSPTVSVLVAAYEAAPFVQTAIRSVLLQSLRNLELIIVDDASSDGTWDRITELARRDERLIPLRRTRRGGPAAARNDAIARASGRWLAVLDADDLFLPERLERMVALAEASGSDLLADNLIERDFETGALLGPFFPDGAMRHPGAVCLAEMVRRDMPDLPGRARFGFLKPILRRSFLAERRLAYRPHILASEDFLLYAESVVAGARFHLTPEAWYVYSRRTGSISSRRASSVHLSAANRMLLGMPAVRLREQAELRALLLRRQALIDSDCFDLAFEEGRYLEACRYAWLAEPRRIVRRFRISAGSARRRIAGRAVALMRGTASQ